MRTADTTDNDAAFREGLTQTADAVAHTIHEAPLVALVEEIIAHAPDPEKRVKYQDKLIERVGAWAFDACDVAIRLTITALEERARLEAGERRS